MLWLISRYCLQQYSYFMQGITSLFFKAVFMHKRGNRMSNLHKEMGKPSINLKLVTML